MAFQQVRPVVQSAPPAPKPATPQGWDIPKEEWVYVTIPKEDPLGWEFPRIRINLDTFDSGTTHLVPPDIAKDIEDRVKTHELQMRTYLNSRPNAKAIQQLEDKTKSRGVTVDK